VDVGDGGGVTRELAADQHRDKIRLGPQSRNRLTDLAELRPQL
jgi:hypothetical protein